ncbi:ssDNA endonuclease and repair protein rad10 [Arachnomyces sp. PD_36]|nr:ssDNA endonuclease and repair protein rad10 [Arachnomyces sp. PD_36]
MDDDFEDADFSAFLEPSNKNTPLRAAAPSSAATATARKVVPEPRPPKVEQPKPQALPSRAAPSAVLVSARQKGNPILNHIRLLPWEYADIPADYVIGNSTCALFLSLKYHRLHPEYIYTRINGLRGKYNLRILLTMVDIENHEDCLKELSKTSLVNNLTLILCWSAAEAAHYLELYKSSENAPPNAIRSQQAQSYEESLVEFITAPRSINKSDAASLISTFGSLQNAVNAQPEQISLVPGWGEKKVQQWCGAVKEEFRIRKAAKRGGQSTRGGARAAPQTGRVAGSMDRSAIPSVVQQNASNEVNEDDEDEEEALLTTEMDNASKPDSQRENNPMGEDMSEGVMAALAKLRQGGG